MKKQAVNFVETILNPFMGYLAPQFEDSFSSDRYCTRTGVPTFNPEKFYLLIFVFALAFIAVISPILCFGSLFMELHFEGLWYFWLITLFEAGYLVWTIGRKIVKK